jgi:hypothetical protein
VVTNREPKGKTILELTGPTVEKELAMSSVVALSACLLLSQTSASDGPTKIKQIPDSGLSLGVGVSLDKIWPPYPTPFAEIKKRQVISPSSRIDMTVVTNSAARDNAIGIDLRAKTRTLFATTDYELALSRDSSISERSFRLVITGEGVYGTDELEAPSLNTHAKELIAATKMREFAEIYGTHYVLREHRVARIAIVLGVDHWSENTQTKLKAAMGGGASLKLGGGELKASIQADLKNAASREGIDIHIDQLGGEVLGGGYGAVVKAMLKGGDLDQLGASLETILKGFNRTNSAIGGVTLASMREFGWNPAAVDMWNDQFESKLQDCAERYACGSGIRRSIKIALGTVGENLKPKLLQAQDKYSDYLLALANFQEQLVWHKNKDYLRKPLPIEPIDSIKGIIPDNTFGPIEKIEMTVTLDPRKFPKGKTGTEQFIPAGCNVDDQVVGVYIDQEKSHIDREYWTNFNIMPRGVILVEGYTDKPPRSASYEVVVFVRRRISIDRP